jgi:hypothetical protein
MIINKPFKWVLIIIALFILSTIFKIATSNFFVKKRVAGPVFVDNRILFGVCNEPSRGCTFTMIRDSEQDALKRALESELAWEPFGDNDFPDWAQPIQITAVVNGETREFRCRGKIIFDKKKKLSWHAPETTVVAQRILNRIMTDVARELMTNSSSQAKE